MATNSGPPKSSNLNLFGAAIRDAAGNYADSVSVDKPVINELAKSLKNLKLLIALSDYEVKELRRKK